MTTHPTGPDWTVKPKPAKVYWIVAEIDGQLFKLHEISDPANNAKLFIGRYKRQYRKAYPGAVFKIKLARDVEGAPYFDAFGQDIEPSTDDTKPAADGAAFKEAKPITMSSWPGRLALACAALLWEAGKVAGKACLFAPVAVIAALGGLIALTEAMTGRD